VFDSWEGRDLRVFSSMDVADHPLASSFKVKNECSCTYTLSFPYAMSLSEVQGQLLMHLQ
jgi:hypothetical protein